MCETYKKKYVCTEQNESGFTFIEIIISLMILSITIPFIVYLFQFIEVEQEEDVSVFPFFFFVRNEAIQADVVTTEQNVLFFHMPTGETAKIEHYNNVIRRTVIGKGGHEIYAREITDFQLTPVSYGTKITLTTTVGKTYEKIIAHY